MTEDVAKSSPSRWNEGAVTGFLTKDERRRTNLPLFYTKSGHNARELLSEPEALEAIHFSADGLYVRSENAGLGRKQNNGR
jgi:hypothetical protein